jgi:Xaa-Pro aminopeptidase
VLGDSFARAGGQPASKATLDTSCGPFTHSEQNHEPPFLDIGDDTPIQPGMVFTIEPGVYSSTVGGFRHSDTVVVTDDGIDVLTDYPKDIESLTLEL